MEDFVKRGAVVWRSDINAKDDTTALVTQISPDGASPKETILSLAVFSDGAMGGTPKSGVPHVDSDRARQLKSPEGVWCTIDEDVARRRKKAELDRRHQEAAEKLRAEKNAEKKRLAAEAEKEDKATVKA